MKSILIIFNGLKFPYYLMEYALVLARKQGLSVHALFIKTPKETSFGYGYPRDRKAAEQTYFKEQVDPDNIRIVHHHMKLAIDMATFEDVTCTTGLINNCSLDEIFSIIASYDRVFVDAAFDNQKGSMLGNTAFTLRELTALSPYKVKHISENMEIPLK